MENLIKICAPGKVILHGEHAVVYCKKAIACAVNATIQVELDYVEGGNDLTLNFPNLHDQSLQENGIHISLKLIREFYQTHVNESGKMKEQNWHEILKEFILSLSFLHEAENKLLVVALSVVLSAYIKVILEQGKLPYPALTVSVSSNDLPLGAGLGSSAAYSVALVTAFMLFAKELHIQDNIDYKLDEASLLKINNMAFCMEKLVHGNPSGIDNSVSTYGGAVVFASGNLKHFSNFPKLDFLIVDTHATRNTKALVSSVRQKREKFPQIMNGVLQSMHEISEAAEEIFTQMPTCNDGDTYATLFEKLKELIEMNQHLLNCIGVGHPSLDSIHHLAEKFQCACKLTGAGGGGCAIILLNPDTGDDQIEMLKNEISSRGFSSRKAVLGGEGVKILHCDRQFLDNLDKTL